jgi:transcriptional regulator with XRE-family HTH domain
MSAYATILRAARKRSGITQAALAVSADASLATIQNLEAGRANPSMDLLQRVLDVLGLRVEIVPELPDWDALVSLGLPLAARQERQMVRDEEKLLKHLRRAVAMNHGEGETQPYEPRLVEALQALLLALRDHYPTLWRRSLARSTSVSAWLPAEIDGRLIKLRRLARARLGEYL